MPYLHEVFREAAERFGSRYALDDLCGRLSFAQALERSLALAGALEQLGLRPGDRVAILAENCVDYMMYHYATAMLGLVLLPLNTRHTNAERLWILNNAEAGALVADEAHAPLLGGTEGRMSVGPDHDRHRRGGGGRFVHG